MDGHWENLSKKLVKKQASPADTSTEECNRGNPMVVGLWVVSL